VILSIVAMLAVVQHWSVLIKKFGSIAGVLVSGNLIYRLTVAGKLPGQIPYFDCFGLAAACLAGIYSARAGKIKLLTLLPLAIIILADIGQGGRAKIVIAGILFLSAYFLARLTPARVKTFQAISNGRQLLTLGLVLVILFAAAEFVRSYRGAFEGFYGTSKELSKFERSVFITPSMYLYLSSHPGVFSAYWKAGGEHPFPGSYTFAPLFRILSRFGIADYIPHFQKHYNIPITTNTGTYLRELHADFGIAGILVIPYLLGFFCTILWLKIRRQPRLVSIALLTHIYVIVAFSYFYQVTRLGQWAVSLIASLIVSYFIDRRCYAGGARQDLAPLE
jgi:oligosaccharide repeat unit polymerase